MEVGFFGLHGLQYKSAFNYVVQDRPVDALERPWRPTKWGAALAMTGFRRRIPYSKLLSWPRGGENCRATV